MHSSTQGSLGTAIARNPVGIVVLVDVARTYSDVVVILVETIIVSSAVLLCVTWRIDASGVGLKHELSLYCSSGVLAIVFQPDLVEGVC